MRDGEHRAQGGSDIVRTRTLRFGLGIGALLGATVLVLGLSAAALGTINDGGQYNLTVPNNTESKTVGTTGGAIVEYVGSSSSAQALGSSGTGVFEPFYRLQNSPSEAGYNTDGTLQFDTSAGKWTHSILLSQIPVIQVGGNDYWEVWADINESNSTPLISLNKFEVYFASGTGAATLTGYQFPLNGTNPAVTEEYAFDGSFEINDVNQGSGRADLRYLIPVTNVPANCDYFNPACTTYFVLYTQWGSLPTAAEYASDGGFEELDVKQYPTLQIVKNTVGGDGTFGFTVAGPTPLSPSITTSGGTGSTSTYAVIPGTFQITESSSPAGWTFVGATCSFNGGAPSAYTLGNNLTIGSTDHVVCTFTNSAPGYLKLVKNTVGGDGTFSFTNTDVTGLATSLTTSGGTASSTSSALVPGSGFAVGETVPAGWDLTSAVCKLADGTTVTGSLSGSTITGITVEAGKTTTCTFTDTARGYLKLVKNTVGGDGTFSFTGTGTGVDSSFNLTTSSGTAQTSFTDLTPGSGYAVSESSASGWTQTSATCTGENSPSDITIVAGQTVTCTFTNTKYSPPPPPVTPLTPKIAIVKVANPTHLGVGGGSVTYTYTVTNPGQTTLSTVTVTDDRCAPVTYVSGDANHDSQLETTEAWTYTCTTTLTQTTTNTATATGYYNGLPVTATAQAVVTVAPPTPTPTPTATPGGGVLGATGTPSLPPTTEIPGQGGGPNGTMLLLLGALGAASLALITTTLLRERLLEYVDRR